MVNQSNSFLVSGDYWNKMLAKCDLFEDEKETETEERGEGAGEGEKRESWRERGRVTEGEKKREERETVFPSPKKDSAVPMINQKLSHIFTCGNQWLK